MRRSTVLLHLGLTAALAFSLLAATDASSAATLTDACADPVAERDAGVLPFVDLCELSFAASTVGEGEQTTLDVAVRVASVDRTQPTLLRVRFDTPTCRAVIVLADADRQYDDRSALEASCEGDEPGPYTDCTNETDLGVVRVGPCTRAWPAVDIASPRLEGNTYVWSIDVGGDIADLIGPLPAGTEIEVGISSMGLRQSRSRSTATGIVCGPGYNECTAAGGDWMARDGVVVTVAEG